MRFQRIFEHVYCRPWLITGTGWESVHRLVSERITNPVAERPSEDIWGDPLPVMQIKDGVAVIPVEGVIGRKMGAFEKSCGATDVLDIAEDLQNAMSNPTVRDIVLDVNSPGGTVSGVPELAQLVANAAQKKNVVAFANDDMCSAAYWISAGARRIYAMPSSSVGSIGVFVPWIDKSAAYEQMGMSVEIIKAGKYKGMGYPGTSLTNDQRDLIQSDVDDTYSQFTGFVKSFRTGVEDDSMQGQSFKGTAAADRKLVSGIVSGMPDLLARLVDSRKQA